MLINWDTVGHRLAISEEFNSIQSPSLIAVIGICGIQKSPPTVSLTLIVVIFEDRHCSVGSVKRDRKTYAINYPAVSFIRLTRVHEFPSIWLLTMIAIYFFRRWVWARVWTSLSAIVLPIPTLSTSRWATLIACNCVIQRRLIMELAVWIFTFPIGTQ